MIPTDFQKYTRKFEKLLRPVVRMYIGSPQASHNELILDVKYIQTVKISKKYFLKSYTCMYQQKFISHKKY